jgi:hypothetical protein
MSDLDQAISDELQGMSVDELRRELERLMSRQEKARERLNSPESKAARKAYYEKVKDTPEWKASRQEAAEKRRKKEQALKNLIRARAGELGLDANELRELGL